MEKYYYTKHIKATPFKDYMMMELSKDLYRKIHFGVKEFDRAEDLEENNITVFADEILLSTEWDAIANAINAYGESNEYAVRYGIEINTMNPAADFGRDLSVKMASANIYRGKHVTKILYNGVEKEITSHIVDKHQVLILNMLTGSLTDVYRTVSAMVADELFSQAEIDEMKKRLELYLGV